MADAQDPMTRLVCVRSISELRTAVATLRTNGSQVGFVPTMGALHDGHLALVREARKLAGKVVVSIFVNPLQFAPTEDLDRYPRNEAADIARLQDAGCDLVFLPTPDVLYPKVFASRIEMSGPALGLESDVRPQFFSGVATVVMKLFNAVAPDLAVFGEKDYQQLAVVRAMVRDFDLPLSIVGHPTVREDDGLAMSSRNAYLTNAERQIAPKLNQALQQVRLAVQAGQEGDEACTAAAQALTEKGFDRVDYLVLRDADTLAPVGPDTRSMRLLVAAWLGKTRLIDNIAV